MKTKACLVALALLAFALPALAGSAHPWEAKVVAVYDGDTITVMHAGTRTKVRLAYIDAPEKSQPGGVAAGRYLTEQLRGQTVTVQPLRKDLYGRTIGVVFLRSGRDVNSSMVRAGWAWVYLAYCKDPVLVGIEAQARAAKRGLWGLPGVPVEPWRWRKGAR